MLHGCTQDAATYDQGAGWSKAADEHGFAVLLPEQQRANNPNLCFNWYLDKHSGRDRGEAQSIRQMIAEMETRFGIDPARIFVTGLSAGGAMTAVMLASYPEVFAGGGIIAGLPFGCARNVPQAFDRMRGHGGPSGRALSQLVREASDHRGPWPTLSVWHGGDDPIVSPSNAQGLIEQWGGLHGVSKLPDRTDTVDGYPHKVWLNAEGREVLEDYSITGMGHGTPLETRQGDTDEIAGAHMLEAGISSTRHLLHFWGLAGEPAATARPKRAHSAKGSSLEDEQWFESSNAYVGQTITDALRFAGLMK